MYIIIDATKLERKYSSTLKFNYNVVRVYFNDLPLNVKKCLNLLIPENANTDRFITAPVIHHTAFSNDEFNVVAAFDELQDAVEYCKSKNAAIVKKYKYAVSICVPDEAGSLCSVMSNEVVFSSYEDVTEHYLLEMGKTLLNVKESVTQINEEDENDEEQSGKEESVETPCRPAGCCGCNDTTTDNC